MLNNSIGTLIYTLLFGKKVGLDTYGNTFFIHKKIKNKKWVLYKNKIDPTLLSVEWQSWLTDKEETNIPTVQSQDYDWQKKREPNKSGTPDAYHPQSNNTEKKIDKHKQSIWRPE